MPSTFPVRSVRRLFSAGLLFLMGFIFFAPRTPIIGQALSRGENFESDHAPGTHENRASFAGQTLNFSARVLEDPSKNLDYAQILNRQDHFHAVRDPHYNFGITASAIWLRIAVTTDENSAAFNGWLELAWPYVDFLDVYVTGGGPRDVHFATGRSRPYTTRALDHRFYVFPLELSPGETRIIYVRAVSDTFLMLPLRFVSRDEYSFEREREGYVLGLYYGMLLVVFFYSLFIFISLRESAFLSYSGYVVFLAMYQLCVNGIAFRFWPEATWWNKFSLPVFLTLVILAAADYIRRFLNLRKYSPALNSVWLIFCVLCVCLLGAVAISYPTVKYLINAATAFLILALITGVRSWRQGNHAARLFVFAWIAPILGYLIQLSGTYRLIPGWSWLIYAGQFGTALEVVLLSLAMADRINELKKKQQDWNQNLERQVRQRTGELNLALKEIHREAELTRIELDIAAGIQKGIMPAGEMRTARAHTVTFLQSFAPVGGDYFDIFEFPATGHTAFLMADASGHGVPAALITTMAKICFMDATRQHGPVPRDILLSVNDAIARLIKTHEYITAALLVVGPGGEALYSSAGHRFSFHYQRESGEVEAWDTEGILLGIYENDAMPATIAQYESRVAAGDRFLMFTDGFTDVKNANEERFGEERLVQLLAETADQDLLRAREMILDVWREFQRNGSREDDCTFTLIEF